MVRDQARHRSTMYRRGNADVVGACMKSRWIHWSYRSCCCVCLIASNDPGGAGVAQAASENRSEIAIKSFRRFCMSGLVRTTFFVARAPLPATSMPGFPEYQTNVERPRIGRLGEGASEGPLKPTRSWRRYFEISLPCFGELLILSAKGT